ncbi:hypothetical protein [Rurimicrobium arvi]|uniref:Carboxypeptidase regulatory-like domain-containing protein n=1 Tax=Rurimicrobium arvi TaxID=2049916 RepID=A0ABP8MST7_9BACT
MKIILFSFLFFSLYLIALSCSIGRTYNGKNIEGKYKVVKVKNIRDQDPQLTCIVLDKFTNKPLRDAVIIVMGNKAGGFTDSTGQLTLSLHSGTYYLQAKNGGNSSLTTKMITFAPYTNTIMMFKLGTNFIR